MRNPLAPSVFLLRNSGKSLPLIGVIVLAILLIAGIVSIMNSIPLSIRTTYGYSKNYLGVTPRGNNAMTPILRAAIEGGSPVELDPVMVCRANNMEVKSIVGPWPFVVIGLGQEDMRRYVQRLGGGEVVGRFPKRGASEAIVSEPVARNLGKKLGDVLIGPDDPNNYSPQRVKIVGIIKMKPWMALVPIEYHRIYHFPPIDLLIVMAKNPAEQDTLDRWAYEKFKGQQARIFAYYRMEKETDDMFKILYSILNVVIALLVVVITLMMAMLMNIYQGQRTQEFGLLQAIGFSRRVLLRRVLTETAIVMVVGWGLGVVVALGLLFVVRQTLFEPRAFMLDPFDPLAYLYTLPVPIAIFVTASVTIAARFRKFDPVGVVERRIA